MLHLAHPSHPSFSCLPFHPRDTETKAFYLILRWSKNLCVHTAAAGHFKSAWRATLPKSWYHQLRLCDQHWQLASWTLPNLLWISPLGCYAARAEDCRSVFLVQSTYACLFSPRVLLTCTSWKLPTRWARGNCKHWDTFNNYDEGDLRRPANQKLIIAC